MEHFRVRFSRIIGSSGVVQDWRNTTAAGEQLGVWAERVGCQMIKHAEGADPAAVVYDSITAAKARNVDVLLCDTAGRLHNKKNLMEELKKMNRIIDREFPDAYRENLIVLDGTTGQNALNQAREFGETAQLTGIILTKMDGTSKGLNKPYFQFACCKSRCRSAWSPG